MKLNTIRSKFAMTAALAGAMALANPGMILAQRGNDRGGRGSTATHGDSRAQAPRGNGGQAFTNQGGHGQPQGFQRGPNTQNNAGRLGFSGGERGAVRGRSFDSGFRGEHRDRDFRGGVTGYFAAPRRFYGGFSGAYAPGFGAAFTYGVNACNPNGFYDAYGNWYPDPNCPVPPPDSYSGY